LIVYFSDKLGVSTPAMIIPEKEPLPVLKSLMRYYKIQLLPLKKAYKQMLIKLAKSYKTVPVSTSLTTTQQ